MSDFFQGQVAVITGAASVIGAALARALVQRQCHVALVDRQADALQALALALADKGVRSACTPWMCVTARPWQICLPR